MYINRLISGLLRVILSMVWIVKGPVIEKSYYFKCMIDLDWTSNQWFWIQGLFVITYIIALYQLVKGCYHLATVQTGYISMFEDKARGRGSSVSSGYQNIRRVLEYRNGLMQNMSNAQAAEEYRKTAWLEGMMTTGGSNMKRTAEYINGNLASMSNQAGYDWLKNGAKD